MSIYAGNWSDQVTEQDLKAVFTNYSTVNHVQFLTDRKAVHPHCFALVEIESDEPEAAGIKGLDGAEWKSRACPKLTVLSSRLYLC
jgi:RNA recognition motif-containing protein